MSAPLPVPSEDRAPEPHQSGEMDDEPTLVVRRPVPARGLRFWAFAGLSAMLLAGSFYGGRAVADLPIAHRLFAMRAFHVNGLARTSRDDAMRAAGVFDARSLLALNLEHGVSAVEQLPWVRRATLRRQLPDRIHLDVVEHIASLSVNLGELWLVNTLGEPFKPFGAEDGLVLPMVTGLVAQPRAEVAYAQQASLIANLQEAIALHEALVGARDDLYNVEQLHHDDDLGWSVTVLLGRAQGQSAGDRASALVHLGHDPQARLGQLVDSLGSLAERRLVPKTIWAANLHQADRVQVSLHGEPFVAPAASAARPAAPKRTAAPKRPAQANH